MSFPPFQSHKLGCGRVAEQIGQSSATELQREEQCDPTYHQVPSGRGTDRVWRLSGYGEDSRGRDVHVWSQDARCARYVCEWLQCLAADGPGHAIDRQDELGERGPL
jgi:hypothetical protein